MNISDEGKGAAAKPLLLGCGDWLVGIRPVLSQKDFSSSSVLQ